jgi:heme A synthase
LRPAQSGYIRLTLALLFSTAALISLGGLVRITGSGLGCPDWPLCHGRIIPPFELAPWIEYFHRLAAASVSVLVVAFSALTWLRHRGRPWLLWPATLAPLLLVAQIWLGRLTVLNEIPPDIAWIHTAAAMAILGVVVVPVAAAYPPLVEMSARLARRAQESPAAARLPFVLSLAALAVYLLLLTGAYVTRSGAAAACPAFPACGGLADPATPGSTLEGIHMLHRIVAAGAALVLLIALADCWRAGDVDLRRIAAGTAGLLAAQVGLGVANVLLRLPLWSRGLHLVAAALLWAAVVLLTAAAWRGWLQSFTRLPARANSAGSFFL